VFVALVIPHAMHINTLREQNVDCWIVKTWWYR